MGRTRTEIMAGLSPKERLAIELRFDELALLYREELKAEAKFADLEASYPDDIRADSPVRIRNRLKIGDEFRTPTGAWRVTDIGTRTVIAINISDHQDDPSWFNGPPYAVVEHVFDENDLPGIEID